MDCNKEEALKAKEIAISKMQNNDFFGAQKFILKAQKLFPDLENLNQMIAVCEVHCSASRKINGEMDWYGILQVESTANELSIKKQYRKLALLLHPDKNKFARAEAAFKLIGEAHKILLDQSKRSLHDVLRRANTAPLQPRQTTNFSKHHPFNMQMNVPSKAADTSSTKPGVLNQEHQETSAFPNAATFWTICTFCGTKYKYYVVVMNKQIHCKVCKRTFVGIELKLQCMGPGLDTANMQTHFAVPQHVFPGSEGIRQDIYYKHEFSDHGCAREGIASSTVVQTNSRLKVNTVLGSMAKDAQMHEDVSHQVNSVHVVKEEHNMESSVQKENKKRGQRIEAETSEARGSVFEEVRLDMHDQQPEQHVVTNGSHIASRLGGLTKQSCKEASSNAILVNPFSKRRRKGKSCTQVPQNEKSSFECEAAGFACKKVDKQKEGALFGGSASASEQAVVHKVSKDTQGKRAATNSLKPELISKVRAGFNPRSKTSFEFGEFETKRDADNIAVNQIWSVYDNLDGMPRLYARIKRVLSPGFKLQVTWLKHLPVNDSEIERSKEEFPLACGNFRLGKSEYIHDQHIFSSAMNYEKGVIRNSYAIYPQKGEIWALFKNWNVNWSFGEETRTVYEYEVAEVLSDYAKGCGISIFPLVKVEGYTCLFARDFVKKVAPIWLSYHELSKFSHKIPSRRMTGEDREGIPQYEVSFQMDAAALPSNFKEIFPSIKLQSLSLQVEGSDSITDGFLSEAKRVYQNTSSSSKMTDTMNGMNLDSSEQQFSSQTFCEESIKPQEKGFNAASNTRQANLTPEEQVIGQSVVPNEAIMGDKDISAENFKKGSSSEHLKSMPVSYTSPATFEYPDSQFHDFVEERSIANIKCGQVWAIYSDVDRFPNYYGCIKKVDSENSIVHVKWLDACLTQDMQKRWRKGLPIGCGRFKLVSESCVYRTTDVFSHLVQVKPTGNKGHYDIYPSSGEIWAVFKNWNSGWTRSQFENCEYVMVEILGFTACGIEVTALVKVEGYIAVFRHGQDSKIEIPASEYLRFSHRVPAFRLTEEIGGKLRGYLELDPASVPDDFLIQDTH